MPVTLVPKSNVLSGLSQKYTPQQMNGYVMYRLDPTPASYSEVHVTRSVDVDPAQTGSWDHVTFQSGAAASVHVYFHLVAGEYETKMLKGATPTAAQQQITDDCIWDLQLVGILPHSQSFTVHLEQQRRDREEAARLAAEESERLSQVHADNAAKRMEATGSPWAKVS